MPFREYFYPEAAKTIPADLLRKMEGVSKKRPDKYMQKYRPFGEKFDRSPAGVLMPS